MSGEETGYDMPGAAPIAARAPPPCPSRSGRALDFAAQVAGGLPGATLPASLRPFAKFTPAKRARLSGVVATAKDEARLIVARWCSKPIVDR